MVDNYTKMCPIKTNPLKNLIKLIEIRKIKKNSVIGDNYNDYSIEIVEFETNKRNLFDT